MPLPYWSIRQQIKDRWAAEPSLADWTVYWRGTDAFPKVNTTEAVFFRNTVEFGRETVLAYGNGDGTNLRAQFGSLLVRCFVPLVSADCDDLVLYWLGNAMDVFRGKSWTDTDGNTLSFIGEGSGFDVEPQTQGNWFARGTMMVFEYRFNG